MNPPLGSDDVYLLQTNDLSSAIEGVFFGILITLVTIGFYHLGRQGLFKGNSTSRARLLLAIIILIMTVSCASCFISHVRWDQADISRVGAGNQNEEVVIEKLNTIVVLFGRVTYVLGDGVVVWRAWILYASDDHRIIIRLILAACMLGSCAGAFVDGAFNIKDATNDVDGSGGTKYALYIPLLVTNVVATTLIVYKFLQYRKSIKMQVQHSSNSGGKAPRHTVERILIILIETGCAFFIVWIISALSALGLFTDAGKTVVACIMPHLSSIYPTLIVILVTLHKSEVSSTTGASTIAFTRSSKREREDVEQAIETHPLSFTQPVSHVSNPQHEDISMGPIQGQESNVQSLDSSKSPFFISVGSIRESNYSSTGRIETDQDNNVDIAVRSSGNTR
ncbi:hypothetical protein VKT23_015454 [Stygiomarasmius scandens]|uniref:Uncharacterized protein n=1 Tax=Marasmiellus scandens TaxID=2682957 RepID=A0ABR1J135_9AGAR